MSEKWEKAIQEWYEKSHTANLNYLDLSSSVKPSTAKNAHNISILYDRILLSSKVSLKNFKSLSEQISSLEIKIQKLEKGLRSLT